jgi:hypothetical protein
VKDYGGEMKLSAHKKGRPNRIDLVRIAKALGVTHGHLSRVISGKRESRKLMAELAALLKSESHSESTPTKTKSPK